LFQRAATAEPEDHNFIRKHYLALQAQGIDNQVPVATQLVILALWLMTKWWLPTGNRVMSWGRLSAIGMC